MARRIDGQDGAVVPVEAVLPPAGQGWQPTAPDRVADPIHRPAGVEAPGAPAAASGRPRSVRPVEGAGR